jgi:hypothetical protein
MRFSEGKWWKDVVFDTMRIRSCGDVEEQLFQDYRKFSNGDEKTEGLHTNLFLCGQLGTPREFQIIHWGVVFEEWWDKDDLKTVLRNLSLRLIFGSNVTMQLCALSTFAPTLFVSDGLASHAIEAGYKIEGEVTEWKKLNQQIGECLKKFSQEGVWTHYFRSVVSAAGKPLHLDSTESFRVEAKIPLVNLKGPVQLKVVLYGLDLKYGSPPW